MISNFEIRENSLTPNSVFILLIKGDEKGCEDVLKELENMCKLTEEKIEGFDYVFELPNISDDYMLERVRGRLDFLSSSSLGVAQTFNNTNKTETITIDKAMETSQIPLSSSKTKANVEEGTYTKESKGISLDLSNTKFVVTKEEKTNIDFKNIATNSKLVSGDEKEITIGGDSSLRLARTVPNIKTEEPLPAQNQSENKSENQSENQQNNQQKEQNMEEKLSDIEKENQTIHAYTPEEIQGVSITMEKEKTGLFGNFFGKIKSAINSKKDKQANKDKNNVSKKEKTLSSLLKKENNAEKVKVNTVQKQTKTANNQEGNPFQDLGEGLIMKKGEKSEVIPNTIKKDLDANSVTAKLQVDDIFAAETICDFYGNQPEEKKQENKVIPNKQESPLDKLEKVSAQEEKEVEHSFHEAKSSSEITLAEETKNKQESIEHLKDKKINETETFTLPDKIFAEGNTKREQQVLSPKQEKAPVVSKTESKKSSLPGLDEIGSKISSQYEQKQEERSEEKKEQKGNSLPGLKTLEEKQTVSKSNAKETKIKQKFVSEEKNTDYTKKEVKEGEKSMPEKNENKIISKPKENTAVANKTGGMKFAKTKVTEKIDHTLHIAAPAKDAKYRNYPIEMPLIPTYTFANMDISAIRFAHAMAMATVDDLGRSNNPFLIQGPSGTGKTHFLHALGYEISKKVPQSKILFTNGVRFSRGVQYLLEKGQKAKLDVFFNNAEVLIVDDVHLTAVNEHNREYISKVLNDFLNNRKQIILSSKYPPESLKRFEELVNFKFSLGTITELKVPNKVHFAKLTNKIVTSSFLDLTEQQVQAFFADQSNSLGDVARNVKRVKVLSRMIESSGIKKLSYEDILKAMTAINGENNESEIIKKDFEDITALERNKESSWGNFGFFFPASHIDKFRWVAFAFQEAAKEMGIKGGFNYALKSAYSTEHIISSAFKIANICDLKGLKGAIILGPAFVECKEPIRDNFYDILTHMLEVMMIRCGTINFEDIKKPSAYIKMLGDILR